MQELKGIRAPVFENVLQLALSRELAAAFEKTSVNAEIRSEAFADFVINVDFIYYDLNFFKPAFKNCLVDFLAPF